MVAEPTSPDAAERDHWLGVLADLIARGGGAGALLAPPVVPGAKAFPDAWAPTKPGVALLLRRLLWHAGIERDVELEDRRAASAPPREVAVQEAGDTGTIIGGRMPGTRCELFELRARQARFALGLIGTDDIAGTLAHEIGIAFAVEHRPEQADPYRTAEAKVIAVDPDIDLERGSVATVLLGLGVLAANAGFQQFSRAGRFNGAYEALDYDVLRAGHVPMSALAYLLAVQATVRGESAPPPGLEPPQNDEVTAWMRALEGKRAELRERLGIPADAVPSVRGLGRVDASGGTREAPIAFAGVALEDEPPPRKIGFRWRTHRGGVGLVAGAVFGVGVAATVLTRGMAPVAVFAGAACGHVVGRRVRVPRCSACATVVGIHTTTCPACGAHLRGDISSLSERLEAEERLEESSSAHDGT